MKHFSKLFFLIFLTLFITSCENNDSIVPKPEYGWGKTMAGNDPEETTWPDFSENYWEYTFNLSKYAPGSVGLRITGEFPNVDTRFFNLTVYNDRTTEPFGSIEDFKIEPEAGSQNPFLKEGVTGSNYFEINVIPNTIDSTKYKNRIVFSSSTTLAPRITFLLRIYFNGIEHGTDFGGVNLPKITYFDTTTGKEIGEAPRAKSLYYTRFMGILSRVPAIKSQPILAFTLAPSVLYKNGPTGYVTTANRMHQDSLLMFRFIPPVYPKNVSENLTADVRYWSICVGDTLTHTHTTLVDKTTLVDQNGYVNVIIADPNNSNYNAIKEKAAKMNVNLIEWNVQKNGEPLMAFYRQMHIRSDYQYSVQKITPFPKLNSLGQPDPTDTTPGYNQLANFVLGQHGPVGYKKNVSFFLDNNFKLESIRNPL